MKLVEIKQLKQSDLFKKIIKELNVKGLNKIYIKREKNIDYLDIIIAIINFLEQNKNIFRNLNKDNYENLVIIILVELLEEIEIETDEEQLNKIITLLKNSLLVQKASNFLLVQIKSLYNYLRINCCKKADKDINSAAIEIRKIENVI